METWTEAQVQEELAIHRDDVDLNRRVLALNSDFLRQWFLLRGYALYSAWKRQDDYDYEGFEPYASSSECDHDNVEFPYARSGGDDTINIFGSHPPLFARRFGRVMFARDAKQPHVAIKIVKNASDEYEILRFLFEEGTPSSVEDFNHVIPVLDMLSFGEFWFVVMPRWGNCFAQPPGPTMKEILQTIRSLLKGLTYLHKNRIAHGDMSNSNILINHFGRHENDHVNPDRLSMKQQGQLTYAIFDFDFSTKFPSSWSDEQCRLPYKSSWKGTPGLVPPDTWQGEFDFDPFAFDVGALAMIFSLYYDHLTIHVPMLAPLFDKMITRDIPRRFTAEQALHFLEKEVYPKTSLAQLNSKADYLPYDRRPMPLAQLDLGEEADSSLSIYLPRGRWEGLDPSFLKKWAEYREPPLPRTTRFLRFICEYRWIHIIIVFLRKSMYRMRQAMSNRT